MTVPEIPTEDLEGQLMQNCMMYVNLTLPMSEALWMYQAVQELQLRRLAGSAP